MTLNLFFLVFILASQARYWLLTIPHHEFLPYLPDGVVYLRCQLERGSQTEYLHWQVLAVYSRAVRLSCVKKCFGRSVHAEPSRSEAAREYVWKEDSRVSDSFMFEFGRYPFRRNDQTDWSLVRSQARSGRLDEIPPDIYVRCYNQLRRIWQDHLQPVAVERVVTCFWGKTGTGKSRRAWEEAGMAAYPKDPRSKFWDGYQGQSNVIIDEFRGGIDVSHVLRWFDRYPVIVEVKGSSVSLVAERIWITSNLDPQFWYVDLDSDTLAALMRRINVIKFE